MNNINNLEKFYNNCNRSEFYSCDKDMYISK